MSTLSLPEWFKAHINAIYTKSDETSRATALDEFFGSAASIQLNEETLDVQEKRRRIQAQTASSAATEVKWDHLDETSPGNLEGQYVITVSSKFRVRAGPMQRYVTVSFNAKVVDDPNVSGDDKRRLVSLQEKEEIQQASVHIAHIPKQADKDSATD